MSDTAAAQQPLVATTALVALAEQVGSAQKTG